MVLNFRHGFLNLGHCLIECGELDAGIAMYENCESKFGGAIDLYECIGCGYYVKGKSMKCPVMMQKAVTVMRKVNNFPCIPRNLRTIFHIYFHLNLLFNRLVVKTLLNLSILLKAVSLSMEKLVEFNLGLCQLQNAVYLNEQPLEKRPVEALESAFLQITQAEQ